MLIGCMKTNTAQGEQTLSKGVHMHSRRKESTATTCTLIHTPNIDMTVIKHFKGNSTLELFVYFPL